MTTGECVVYRGERVDTHATSNDALRQVDALQHDLKEGPCLDALRKVIMQAIGI